MITMMSINYAKRFNFALRFYQILNKLIMEIPSRTTPMVWTIRHRIPMLISNTYKGISLVGTVISFNS